jgi:hypothetical protein
MQYQTGKTNIRMFFRLSKRFKPPPTPPPPPPPPPCVTYIPSSTRIASKASCSLILSNISSPRNSYSSSGSSRTPQRDLPSSPQIQTPPKPPQTPSCIPFPPPPPLPPPFPKGINNSAKGPPPPSQLPQFTPLGKDGAPLPKLKPLHWDKVRAAPDRSMVKWDKLYILWLLPLVLYKIEHIMNHETG